MREDSLQILYRLEPNPRAAFSKIDEIKHRIDLLENRMIDKTIPIAGWQLKTAIYKGYKQYDILKDWEFIDIGAKWGGDELTGFFKAKATMPELLANSKTFLDISFGGEALLYINEKPHQGVDFDRKLVPLDKYFNEGAELDLFLEVSVRNAPYDSFRHDIRVHHVFEKADIVQIDTDIEDLYYYGWLIYDIANSCEDGEYKTFIIDNLDFALKLVDFNEKELISFKKGVMDSISFIKTTFYESKKFKKWKVSPYWSIAPRFSIFMAI